MEVSVQKCELTFRKWECGIVNSFPLTVGVSAGSVKVRKSTEKVSGIPWNGVTAPCWLSPLEGSANLGKQVEMEVNVRKCELNLRKRGCGTVHSLVPTVEVSKGTMEVRESTAEVRATQWN